MMEEIWKDIDFTNGEYQVSNLGRVKSMSRKILLSNGNTRTIKEKILKNLIDSKKYYMVSIYNKKYRTHRLIANAFIPNLGNKPYINHKDSNRVNNLIENLEWVTHEENMKHAWDNKRFPKKFGKDHARSKAINQYDKEGNFVKKWDSLSDVQRELNIKTPLLSAHLQRKKYKFLKGFVFEFA
jgi:hypothetical protein